VEPSSPPRGSSLDAALGRVGDRWSLLVVDALLDGPRRFGDLRASVKRLEHGRVVVSRPYSTRPLRLSYELTADGLELAGVLRLLAAWGAGGADAEPLRHAACGTPLEARWFCATCERPVDDGESSALRFV
jgi:DNA-binding HxlR family transcriptional regulator